MIAKQTFAWGGLEELRPLLRRRFGRRCRDESTLDDLVQETLVRAARYRGGLLDPCRLTAWVMRIATNVHHGQLHADLRLPRPESQEWLLERVEGREAAPGEFPPQPGVHVGGRPIERDEVLRHLDDALGKLSSADHHLIDAYYSRGQTCAEVAQDLGIVPNLAKVRLFRARQRLKRLLERGVRKGFGRLALELEVAR